MNLITRETAARIWECYREIETGEKLLSDIKKVRDDNHGDPHAQHLKDAFGRRRDLQLGIPSGHNSHKLFDVPEKLAESVIRAHIASKRAELIEANEQARIELGDQSSAPKKACPLIGIQCERHSEQVGDHQCPGCDEGE